ncbi:MAG: TIGR00730 family Rossman fold protein [Alcaligenaceae bacterium]|nr:TIGR00730 family Rossman fold protein [Alcaligenaceae bacterium]
MKQVEASKAETIKGQVSEISKELATAAEHLIDLKKAVSVFGSARTPRNSFYYNKTIEISKLLAEAGFSIISGGGPGIMEAANKGCFEAGGHSVGLNIKLPNEQHDNQYQSDSLYFKYFVSRKTTFFMNSSAYIMMPGGFGTMDEVFETLTLIQTGKAHYAPIVFVGSEFWGGLIDWMKEQLLGCSYISASDFDQFIVEDDPFKIVQYITQKHKEHCVDVNSFGLK